ncbi:MAG: acetyltransferase [Pseudomonadota bacterium]|jgi:sugar O-acyltransferase (sialic acid O-acetyltransferase NeuD family)
MKRLVIFGVGKIADVAYHHFVRDREVEVAAFTCDAAWVPESGTNHGLPVVAFEDIERTCPPAAFDLFVAIGYHELNAVRAQKCAEAKAKGYALASYVSPRADLGPWVTVGENCLILDGVGIQPGAKIGDNVSLWNNVLIGHHSTVQDHCWIAAGATIGGVATIGERCFVGLNATIGGELAIGADSFLGAATLVLKSAPERSVFIAPGTEKFRLASDEFLRMTRMTAIGPGRK